MSRHISFCFSNKWERHAEEHRTPNHQRQFKNFGSPYFCCLSSIFLTTTTTMTALMSGPAASLCPWAATLGRRRQKKASKSGGKKKFLSSFYSIYRLCAMRQKFVAFSIVLLLLQNTWDHAAYTRLIPPPLLICFTVSPVIISSRQPTWFYPWNNARLMHCYLFVATIKPRGGS